MIDNKTNYHFKIVSDGDFECLIDIKVSNWIFKHIYNHSLNKLGLKANDIDIENKKIGIDKQYFNVINSSLGKIMRSIEDEIKQDGFKILRYYVLDSYFIKKTSLVIYIVVGGFYLRESTLVC